MTQSWYTTITLTDELAEEERLARLRLIAMGGTIAFIDSKDGAVPSLRAEELSHSVRSRHEIDTVDLATISSVAMSEDHLRLLVREIEDSIADGYDGIVVSHGTDTLEETAYLVALTIRRSRVPLAFTGAMRHHDAPGTDGIANLEDALAFSEQARAAQALGPVVVMNGEIHSARFATKQNTVSLDAFGSPGAGPVGSVTESRVSIWFAPNYNDYVGGFPDGHWPRVDLVHMTTAMDPAGFEAVIESGPAGVVLAGFGGGHAHTAVLEGIDELARRSIPVVAASRCCSGDTLRSTYGVPGTEIDLQARGALMAGILSPVKSRLRLMVALANGLPPSTVFPVG